MRVMGGAGRNNIGPGGFTRKRRSHTVYRARHPHLPVAEAAGKNPPRLCVGVEGADAEVLYDGLCVLRRIPALRGGRKGRKRGRGGEKKG